MIARIKHTSQHDSGLPAETSYLPNTGNIGLLDLKAQAQYLRELIGSYRGAAKSETPIHQHEIGAAHHYLDVSTHTRNTIEFISHEQLEYKPQTEEEE